MATPKARYHIAYPTERTDETKLSKKREFLQELGGGDVIDKYYMNQMISWRLWLEEPKIERLEARDDISLVVPEEKPPHMRPLTVEETAIYESV